MTQVLLPRASGPGRVLGMEIMVPNGAIRNLIREDKLHQIYSQMQVGQAGSGMQTMNQSLYSALVLEKFAITAANNIEVRDLRMRLVASADISASIADITGLTPANIGMKIHRIKKILAHRVRKEQSHA